MESKEGRGWFRATTCSCARVCWIYIFCLRFSRSSFVFLHIIWGLGFGNEWGVWGRWMGNELRGYMIPNDGATVGPVLLLFVEWVRF